MHAYALNNISVPCIFPEILIVCSKCDAVGTFPASIGEELQDFVFVEPLEK